MSHISVDIRLRPIRFAFLVRPDNGKGLQQVFEVSTCLWGGKYNPIVPVFRQVPSWWDRHNLRFESAKQITNGYLDFFEPDFLVETEPGLANGLNFAGSRVLPIAELLPDEKNFTLSGHG